MATRITIDPITRIEGHASIEIMLDGGGNVADARMNVMSLRGFEKFVVGRPVEEVRDIVNRICGICPWQHHLASNKAAAGNVAVTARPTAWGSDGRLRAQYPRASPRRFAPTTGSLRLHKSCSAPSHHF